LIKGKMVAGKFVAVADNTCVGPCKNVKSFEWTCDSNYVPGSEYPAKQPNKVEVAFYKWVMEINHAITLDSKKCAAALSKHYDATSGTLQLWAGGKPAGAVLKPAAAGPTLCGALGAAANPSLGPMKIEVCGTMVRGYFGPFADATGFPFTKMLGKEYLESTGRTFLIKGKMVAGKFVAVTDNTCVGPCKTIPSFESSWKACAAKAKPTPPATGLLIKSDNACVQLGSKGDVTICRVGPKEINISGDVIINGRSLKKFMDKAAAFMKRLSEK